LKSNDEKSTATASEPTFTDDTVSAGATYVYVVAAQDTSFNLSADSPEVASAAQARPVAATFRVTVPADTPADATIHIAGDFQGWNPGKTPMTKAADGTWHWFYVLDHASPLSAALAPASVRAWSST